MARKKIKLKSWDDFMTRFLNEKGMKNGFIINYLNDSINDKEHPELFYISLFHVIKVYPEGVNGMAKKTGLGKRTISRIGAKNSNPTGKTIDLVLKALGFSVQKSLIKLKKNKAA